MSATAPTTLIEQVCGTWDTGSTGLAPAEVVECQSAIVLAGVTADPRFSYVSFASPLEQLLGDQSSLHDRSGSAIATAELVDRLLDGQVASVLAPVGSLAPGGNSAEQESLLPNSLRHRRQEVRRDNVLVRFLVRQIGLDEVSSHRGASAELYRSVASIWSRDLAMSTDLAMLLTLGADRQRHVDAAHEERSNERLPRALGRLQDMGVRSYPRLVII